MTSALRAAQGALSLPALRDAMLSSLIPPPPARGPAVPPPARTIPADVLPAVSPPVSAQPLVLILPCVLCPLQHRDGGQESGPKLGGPNPLPDAAGTALEAQGMSDPHGVAPSWCPAHGDTIALCPCPRPVTLLYRAAVGLILPICVPEVWWHTGDRGWPCCLRHPLWGCCGCGSVVDRSSAGGERRLGGMQGGPIPPSSALRQKAQKRLRTGAGGAAVFLPTPIWAPRCHPHPAKQKAGAGLRATPLGPRPGPGAALSTAPAGRAGTGGFGVNHSPGQNGSEAKQHHGRGGHTIPTPPPHHTWTAGATGWAVRTAGAAARRAG